MKKFDDMSGVAEFKAHQNELRAQLRALGSQFMEQSSREVFAAYPELMAYSWTQYTPYFNDGETCYFGVNDYPELHFESGVCDYCNNEDITVTRADGSLVTEDEITDMSNAVSNIISSIDDDLLMSLYGDHVKVTIYRDGRVDTESYDHE